MKYDVAGGEDYYDSIKRETAWQQYESTRDWVDLAPDIVRQRLVVEGTLHNPFPSLSMVRYCKEISTVLDMTLLAEPITDFTKEYGWCAYAHWRESGMHIYSWENRSPKFFSIDIYTCKKFEDTHVINYTREFFDDNLIKLAWRR